MCCVSVLQRLSGGAHPVDWRLRRGVAARGADKSWSLRDAVSEQDLDRAQIGTALQQMRREAMTQSMWMNLYAPGQREARPVGRRYTAPWWLQDDLPYAIGCRETASLWACV
jgi:hypothetical protein